MSKNQTTNYQPAIVNKKYHDNNNQLHFTLEGIPLCLSNGLRRCMISHIPVVMFSVQPEKKEKWVNMSRFHNEFVEERLLAIPIHTKDLKTLPEKYRLEIDVTNDSDHVMHVTTESQYFRIRNKETGVYLEDGDVKKLLPPNEKTGMYIDFLRLNAKVGNLPAVRLALNADFAVSTGGKDSKANSVFVGMSNTPDRSRIDEAWQEKERELIAKENGGEPLSKEEMETEKLDFYALDSQRYYKDNSFDFQMQSVGVYTCEEIGKLACDALGRLLEQWGEDLETGAVMMNPSKSTMENAWEVKIGGDCYTIGKIMEWMMYVMFYLPKEWGGKGGKEGVLNFCAFRKAHPHDDEANLMLGFAEEADKSVVREYLGQGLNEARRLVADMSKLFA
jgi:hypothetical protein